MTPKIEYTNMGKSGSGKTIIEHVSCNGSFLGIIKWFYNWRRYCFFPEPTTIFDASSLEDIQQHLYTMMKFRRPMSVNNFDVLKEMGVRDMKVGLSPLDNIVNLKKVKHGTQVTIGVAGDLVAALGIEHKFVGGLILADKDEFNALKSEMQKASLVKTRREIEAEIEALAQIAKDYDTEKQSNDTCLAAGAHDALRWLLGLAETSISESLNAT